VVSLPGLSDAIDMDGIAGRDATGSGFGSVVWGAAVVGSGTGTVVGGMVGAEVGMLVDGVVGGIVGSEVAIVVKGTVVGAEVGIEVVEIGALVTVVTGVVGVG